MPRRFVLDVESSSVADLPKVGAAAYWEHPETRLVVACFKVDDGEVVTWLPGDPVPACFPLGDECRVIAHNYLFEWHAWEEQLAPRYGWPMPPPDAFHCTMARALYWGLPAALVDVANALQLPRRIDAAKKTRIKRMARPRKASPLTWWHETDAPKLAELVADCANDVEVEAALDDAVPDLPPREREIFVLDGEINRRGLLVDLPLVERLSTLVQAAGARLNGEVAALTDGRAATTNQVSALMAELARLGVDMPGLTQGAVSAALDGALPAPARNLLQLRQEAARASTAKLAAMQRGASADGRCRGTFQYGGAGRNLRWAGRRVQPQNMPRGTVLDLPSVFALVAPDQPPIAPDDFEMLLPVSTMEAVASMLRGCVIAAPGHMLVSADLAQIEARVVAWLAGQADILAVFARGEDVYTYTAKRLGSDSRALGKVLVLACGYGMGATKFQATASTHGVALTEAQAEAAVFAWRDLNDHIVRFWHDLGAASMTVSAGSAGATQRVRGIVLRKVRRSMRIVLPSGREMTYHDVQVGRGERGAELSYMGVDQTSRKWARIRTYGGKLCENVTSAIARDLMADAMLNLRRQGVQLVATVHDELVAECPAEDAQGTMAAMLATLRTTPPWAPGLPVDASAWTGARYRKG